MVIQVRHRHSGQTSVRHRRLLRPKELELSSNLPSQWLLSLLFTPFKDNQLPFVSLEARFWPGNINGGKIVATAQSFIIIMLYYNYMSAMYMNIKWETVIQQIDKVPVEAKLKGKQVRFTSGKFLAKKQCLHMSIYDCINANYRQSMYDHSGWIVDNSALHWLRTTTRGVKYHSDL